MVAVGVEVTVVAEVAVEVAEAVAEEEDRMKTLKIKRNCHYLVKTVSFVLELLIATQLMEEQ